LFPAKQPIAAPPHGIDGMHEMIKAAGVACADQSEIQYISQSECPRWRMDVPMIVSVAMPIQRTME
jgi:hypothetical protein